MAYKKSDIGNFANNVNPQVQRNSFKVFESFELQLPAIDYENMGVNTIHPMDRTILTNTEYTDTKSVTGEIRPQKSVALEPKSEYSVMNYIESSPSIPESYSNHLSIFGLGTNNYRNLRSIPLEINGIHPKAVIGQPSDSHMFTGTYIGATDNEFIIQFYATKRQNNTDNKGVLVIPIIPIIGSEKLCTIMTDTDGNFSSDNTKCVGYAQYTVNLPIYNLDSITDPNTKQTISAKVKYTWGHSLEDNPAIIYYNSAIRDMCTLNEYDNNSASVNIREIEQPIHVYNPSAYPDDLFNIKQSGLNLPDRPIIRLTNCIIVQYTLPDSAEANPTYLCSIKYKKIGVGQPTQNDTPTNQYELSSTNPNITYCGGQYFICLPERVLEYNSTVIYYAPHTQSIWLGYPRLQSWANNIVDMLPYEYEGYRVQRLFKDGNEYFVVFIFYEPESINEDTYDDEGNVIRGSTTTQKLHLEFGWELEDGKYILPPNLENLISIETSNILASSKVFNCDYIYKYPRNLSHNKKDYVINLLIGNSIVTISSSRCLASDINPLMYNDGYNTIDQIVVTNKVLETQNLSKNITINQPNKSTLTIPSESSMIELNEANLNHTIVNPNTELPSQNLSLYRVPRIKDIITKNIIGSNIHIYNDRITNLGLSYGLMRPLITNDIIYNSHTEYQHITSEYYTTDVYPILYPHCMPINTRYGGYSIILPSTYSNLLNNFFTINGPITWNDAEDQQHYWIRNYRKFLLPYKNFVISEDNWLAYHNQKIFGFFVNNLIEQIKSYNLVNNQSKLINLDLAWVNSNKAVIHKIISTNTTYYIANVCPYLGTIQMIQPSAIDELGTPTSVLYTLDVINMIAYNGEYINGHKLLDVTNNTIVTDKHNLYLATNKYKLSADVEHLQHQIPRASNNYYGIAQYIFISNNDKSHIYITSENNTFYLASIDGTIIDKPYFNNTTLFIAAYYDNKVTIYSINQNNILAIKSISVSPNHKAYIRFINNLGLALIIYDNYVVTIYDLQVNNIYLLATYNNIKSLDVIDDIDSSYIMLRKHNDNNAYIPVIINTRNNFNIKSSDFYFPLQEGNHLLLDGLQIEFNPEVRKYDFDIKINSNFSNVFYKSFKNNTNLIEVIKLPKSIPVGTASYRITNCSGIIRNINWIVHAMPILNDTIKLITPPYPEPDITPDNDGQHTKAYLKLNNIPEDITHIILSLYYDEEHKWLISGYPQILETRDFPIDIPNYLLPYRGAVIYYEAAYVNKDIDELQIGKYTNGEIELHRLEEDILPPPQIEKDPETEYPVTTKPDNPNTKIIKVNQTFDYNYHILEVSNTENFNKIIYTDTSIKDFILKCDEFIYPTIYVRVKSVSDKLGKQISDYSETITINLIDLPPSVPDIVSIIYDEPGDDVLFVAWDNHPIEGDIDTLVEAGLIEYTGDITAYYQEDYTYISSGYWGFGVTTPGSLTIKNFDKLTMLHINGGNWDYNGPLPKDLIFLILSSVNWIYTGSLPNNLKYLSFYGINIIWSYDKSLPINLNVIYLNGNNINWTGYEIGDADIQILSLKNFRLNKMTDEEFILLLTKLTEREGALPNNIYLGDYENYQYPPAEVIAAINRLKDVKHVNNVILVNYE